MISRAAPNSRCVPPSSSSLDNRRLCGASARECVCVCVQVSVVDVISWCRGSTGGFCRSGSGDRLTDGESSVTHLVCTERVFLR